MTAFVVLIGGQEKVGVTNPTVLGPFADHATAEAYINSPQIASWEKDEVANYGGWPTAIVVSDQACSDPIEWMNDATDDAWFEDEEIPDQL